MTHTLANMATNGHSDLDPSPEKFAIASEIIKGRELLGLTQAQLAAQSGVSLSAIKGYETGRNFPGARELRQLCQVLRLSPNRLIFGSENPFPERTWTDQSVPRTKTSVPTARRRIGHLLQLLSSGECQSVYDIVYALGVARHGIEKVYPLCLAGDVETGVDSFVDTRKFVPNLFARLLVDTRVAREFASAVLVAADETDRVNKASDAADSRRAGGSKKSEQSGDAAKTTKSKKVSKK